MGTDAYAFWLILFGGLLAIEIFTGTYVVLIFSIAAGIMAYLTFAFGIESVAWQLFWYAWLVVLVFAIVRAFFGKKRIKSKPLHEESVGQALDSIGEVGTISVACGASSMGEIKFVSPVMGSRVWLALAYEELAVGDKAVVIGIEGNALIVEPLRTTMLAESPLPL